MDAIDDYSMPHWINLSFYSTNKKVAYSSFVPRIKLPPLCPEANSTEDNKENQRQKFSADPHQSEYIHNSLFDYDAYDAQIFTLPPAHGTWYLKLSKKFLWHFKQCVFLSFHSSLQRNPKAKKTSVPSIDLYGSTSSPNNLLCIATPKQILSRKRSEPDIHYGTNTLADLVIN